MFGIHLGAPNSAACLAASCNKASDCSLSGWPAHCRDGAAHPNLRRRAAKRGIDHVIGIGGNWRRVVAMRKKSLPRKSSNRPLREPNRLPAAKRCAFAGALIAGNGRAQQHGAVTTVEIGFHPHGGGWPQTWHCFLAMLMLLRRLKS